MHIINAEACSTKKSIALLDAGLQDKKQQTVQTGRVLCYV